MIEFSRFAAVFDASTVFVPEEVTSYRSKRLEKFEREFQVDLNELGSTLLKLARKANLADIADRNASKIAVVEKREAPAFEEQTKPIREIRLPEPKIVPFVEFPSRPDKIRHSR